jgi:MFS family permease
MPIRLVLLFSTAIFVSMKGSRILFTLYAVDLGAGPLETGLLFGLHGLLPFVVAIYAGRIADRFDNRLLMVWGLGGYAASLTLPFFFPSLATLYLAVPLGGITTLFFVVATQNYVGILSSPENRTRNFSYYSLGESAANVAGPVFVGIAIDAFRHPLTFLCLAIYSAAWCAVVFFKRGSLPHTPRHEEKSPPRRMKDLLALPAMRNALITNGIVMAGMDLFNLYMPIYARGLGLSATAIGLIVGAFAAAAFVTRLAIPPVTARWGERAMLGGALALSAVAFLPIPFLTTAPLLAAAAFVLGLGLGCGQPLSMILAFNAAPRERSAEGIAMRLAVSYGAHVVIPPVFGALGTAWGIAPVFWTCSVLLGGGSLLNRGSKGRRERAG